LALPIYWAFAYEPPEKVISELRLASQYLKLLSTRYRGLKTLFLKDKMNHRFL